ncbi:hypothetical protein N9E97_00550 [Planktomarina sp.]|nr:hypothetical protein [Planktomarina sp.]
MSPKLKISASVVDFVLPLEAGGEDLAGVARAVTIDWRIKNGFELFGNIGPSSLKARGNIFSGSFTLAPTSIFDWSKLTVKLDLDKLVLPNFELEQVGFTGMFYNSFQDLEDAEVVISKVRGELMNGFFEATSLRFIADHYQIDRPLNQQNLQMEYSLNPIELPLTNFQSSLAEGDLKLVNGKLDFKVSATDAEFTGQGLKAKSLTLSTKKLLSGNAMEGAWEFSISDIESKAPAIKIERYSGTLMSTSSGASHRGQAIISNLEMKNNQHFIGQIKNGTVDVDFTSRVLPSKMDVEAHVVLTLKGLKDFSARVSIGASISGLGMLDCLNQKCGLRTLDAEYYIGASGYSLVGSLECAKFDCLSQPSRHSMQTDNTNKFFQAIANTEILNPLSLPVAYLAISSGEAVGTGHLLKF